MVKFLRIAVVGILFTLGNCASDPRGAEEVAQNDDRKLICTREKILGSHMSKKVCRTKQEMEIERKEMEAMLDRDATLQPRSGED